MRAAPNRDVRTAKEPRTKSVCTSRRMFHSNGCLKARRRLGANARFDPRLAGMDNIGIARSGRLAPSACVEIQLKSAEQPLLVEVALVRVLLQEDAREDQCAFQFHLAIGITDGGDV